MASNSTKIEPTTSSTLQKAHGASFMWIILALYFLFAAAYNHLVPFRSGPHATELVQAKELPVNPDEAAHVQNARVYAAGHIPVFKSGDPDFEAHQPPLYYVLISRFISDTGDEPANGARWISIALGGLEIWIAYLSVRTLIPEKPELAQGVAAFVGLLPMNLSLNSSISNDVLTNVMVGLAIWQTARIVRDINAASNQSLVGKSSLLGLILGLGLLTKTSTIVSFTMVGALGLTAIYYKLADTRRCILLMAISFLVGMAIASPWLFRNTHIYGDPFAQHIFTTAFIGTTETAQAMSQIVGGSINYWLLELRLTFESFWGVFDAMQLGMQQWIYGVLALISLISVIGLAKRITWAALSPLQKINAAGLIALTLTAVAGYLRFNMTFFQAQGRYLFPALIPIGILFVSGLSNLMKQESVQGTRPKNVVLVVTAGLAILNVYCIQLINNVFPPVQ